MNYQEINALIDKYYQGLTTAEEEDFLKDQLKNNSEERYSTVYSQLQIMSNIYGEEDVLDKSFDEKILQELSKTQPVRTSLFRLHHILSGVAATALILISIWVTTSLFSPTEVYGTVTDPIAAFAETKKALKEVSKNVNKGVKPATTTIKKAESGLDKSKKVKKLKTLNNTGQLLKSMTKVSVKYGRS